MAEGSTEAPIEVVQRVACFFVFIPSVHIILCTMMHDVRSTLSIFLLITNVILSSRLAGFQLGSRHGQRRRPEYLNPELEPEQHNPSPRLDCEYKAMANSRALYKPSTERGPSSLPSHGLEVQLLDHEPMGRNTMTSLGKSPPWTPRTLSSTTKGSTKPKQAD